MLSERDRGIKIRLALHEADTALMKAWDLAPVGSEWKRRAGELNDLVCNLLDDMQRRMSILDHPEP